MTIEIKYDPEDGNAQLETSVGSFAAALEYIRGLEYAAEEEARKDHLIDEAESREDS